MPLDEPEECLLQLSRIKHFSERVQCLMFRKGFNESIFNIGVCNMMSMDNSFSTSLVESTELEQLTYVY